MRGGTSETASPLFFEDVEVGSSLPGLTRCPSTQQLVMFGTATGDFYPLHYDKDAALRAGLPGVIVQGRLKASFLAQMLRRWIGAGGAIRKMSVQHRGMDLPGNALTCGGIVTSKYAQGATFLVECDIWVENAQGERTVKGTATVLLPSSGASR